MKIISNRESLPYLKCKERSKTRISKNQRWSSKILPAKKNKNRRWTSNLLLYYVKTKKKIGKMHLMHLSKSSWYIEVVIKVNLPAQKHYSGKVVYATTRLSKACFTDKSIMSGARKSQSTKEISRNRCAAHLLRSNIPYLISL